MLSHATGAILVTSYGAKMNVSPTPVCYSVSVCGGGGGGKGQFLGTTYPKYVQK